MLIVRMVLAIVLAAGSGSGPTAASITASPAARATTMTDSLMQRFVDAWNANDRAAMVAMLQEDAFFKSPFQLRVGRAEIARTVLTRNPPMLRNSRVEEQHSTVHGDIAWSIGHTTAEVYDGDGHRTAEPFSADYVFVFTRHPGEPWRIQIMIYHEQ
ncbi:MAG TPA: nuclear transport factor 2 family protein [Longimicrobiales bacterium]